MRKIRMYLWAIAGISVFVICMLLFVSGIEDKKIDNANELLTDNKISNESSEPTSNNLNKEEANIYENTKPKEGEIEIKLGAKVDVEKERVPKEKFIEAIAKGDKKVTEKDIIAIAKELNMSVSELKKEIENAEKVY